uniref:Cytochrome P450 CYP82D47-like n=1 Tax=Nelumbo nucifera TaxID=4432 RepID=A0A822XY16_NELNU|nr:TPA_asm: hypothetical protein HUJ06_025564 [Nelumbo nucifera]
MPTLGKDSQEHYRRQNQDSVHRLLVVNSWEVAKECFTINDKAFSNRPSTVAIRLLGYNRAMFGFAPYGSYWREIRKIATLQLLSNNRLEMLKHIQASEIDMSIRHLYELWVNKTTATASLDQGRPNQVLVEMKQWFGNLTLNIITRMVAGKRVAGVTDEGDDALRCQKAIRDFFHLMGLFILPDAIPFLGWLDLQGYKRAMRRTAKELDCFLEVWLQEHKHRILSSDAIDEKDFMDIMLSILEDSKLPDHNLGTIIKSTCLVCIFDIN